MSMPEFVIQKGVRLAWDFIRKNDFILGHDLRELPTKRQEEYRETLRNEEVTIALGFPLQKTRLPAFSIVLRGESEDSAGGQFVGDMGPSFHEHPVQSLTNEQQWALYEGEEIPPVRDFEAFEGVLYSDTQDPQFIGVGGEISKAPVTNHPLREKNTWQQRKSGIYGDEQYEKMGQVQRLWNENTHKMQITAVGDRANVDIMVSTTNAEKTMIYWRLLRRVLRHFKTWFTINNVIDATFSGSDLGPDDSITPTSGITAYQRVLSMNFLHYDFSFEVASVIEHFILEMDMATKGEDGTLNFTQVATYDSRSSGKGDE